MADAFKSRLDQVFGALAGSAAGWSVNSGQIERREWRPTVTEEDSGDEEEENGGKYEEFIKLQSEGSNNVGSTANGEEDDMPVGAMVGMDCTLDFEEEEDRYDRVAMGRDNAVDRIYMKDIEDTGLGNLSMLPTSFRELKRRPRDSRAHHVAAATRLAEDAREAELFGGELLKPTQNPSLKTEFVNLKPELKRKQEDKEQVSKKRVRFSEDTNVEEGPIVPVKKSEEVVVVRDRYKNVPDHVRHPWKYTHYTLDWEEDQLSIGSNSRALHATIAALNASKNVSDVGTRNEVPKSVKFVPRASLSSASSSSSSKSSRPDMGDGGGGTVVLPVCVSDEKEEMMMMMNETDDVLKPVKRSYRSKSTVED